MFDHPHTGEVQVIGEADRRALEQDKADTPPAVKRTTPRRKVESTTPVVATADEAATQKES